MFDTLSRWSRQNGAASAILATGDRRALSWTDLPDTITRLAAAFATSGATRTSRIALVLPPGPEAVIAFLAAMRTGIAVPLNPELTATELAATLARLRPHLIVFRAGLPPRVETLSASLGVPALELTWRTVDAVGRLHVGAAATAAPIAADDPLTAPVGTRLILQTSGTTSQPKLVPLTAHNLDASAAALIASLQLSSSDRGLNLLPQFHIGGLWDLVAGPLLSGGSVICGGQFSLASFEAGCALAPSWLQLVPTMLRAVLQTANPVPPGLRFIRSVSAALPVDLKTEAEARLGVPVVEIYGMTEAAGVIASSPLDRASQRAGSVGRAAGPHITIRDASGKALPPDHDGEVVIRGTQLSPGYIAAPPDDAAAFAADGFHTGDLGRVDDHGNLWLVGRRKDLINRGGEMIAPAEIEAALLGVPGLIDAAVFAVPHATLGEEIAAAVVAAATPAGADLAATVRAAVRPVLGPGRLPAYIHVIDALPRTAGGKLQRRLLAERYRHTDATSLVQPPHGASSTSSASSGWPDAPLARWVAEIWAPILGLPVFGPDDDFFAAGGGSLHAAQAAAIVQARVPDEIVYVSSVYDAPTPRRQAAFIETHHPAVAGRVLGQAVRLDGGAIEPVTAELRDRFAAALGDPLPAFAAPAERNPRAILIVGAPRSGSTLLRAMLAGHPRLFAPPELYLLSHRDLKARRAWYGLSHASQLEGLPRAWMGATGVTAAEAITQIAALEADAFTMPDTYRLIQAAIGDRLLVDKTPFYGVHRHVLAAAASVFDDVFFLHLSRHPYGMIRSFEEAKLAQLWWPRLAGPDAGADPFHPRQLAELVWERIHATVADFLSTRDAATWLHVRYEDLVDDPGAACRAIAAAIGIDAHPDMLEPFRAPALRMTDGLYPESRMIGDPKFHGHRTIARDAAHRWKEHYHRDFLAPETWALASALGHVVRVEDASTREVFDV